MKMIQCRITIEAAVSIPEDDHEFVMGLVQNFTGALRAYGEAYSVVGIPTIVNEKEST